MSFTTREFFEASTLKWEEIDRFLNPNAHNYGVFDSELGYVRKNSVLRDGIDASYTISRYGRFGERLMSNFAGIPRRDGETWQEYLWRADSQLRGRRTRGLSSIQTDASGGKD